MAQKTLIAAMLVVFSSVCVMPPLAFTQSSDMPSVSAPEMGARVVSRPDLQPVFSGRIPQAFTPHAWTVPSTAKIPSEYDLNGMSEAVTRSLIALGDKSTGVAPSHTGHPGLQEAAFLYDKAVDALVLKAAGREREARLILDYFSDKLAIPLSEIRRNSDANGIYGILKLVPSVDDPKAVGFINAFRFRSTEREGEGAVEYWITPGPMAFVVMAFLQTDPKAYRAAAEKLGEALLIMQREDGGITDGDRDVRNVHTEPHMDALSAFMMLYDVTSDPKWRTAADRAWAWFEKNVFRAQDGIIYQGIRPNGPAEIFATDAYSWSMAGRGGERMSLEALSKLTDRMLRQGLSAVTLELPDGKTKTLTLVDFADAKDMRLVADRSGFHPMGSVEWIGGVILCLQKNAVRFWEAGDDANRSKAKVYKALAEFFSKQAMDSFYSIDGLEGLISFYATGQWMATGHGWRTPYFYVKDPLGNPVIKGGSTISAWPVLPWKRENPFKRNDDYGRSYDAIPLDDAAEREASEYIASVTKERSFVERVPAEMAEEASEIAELWRINQHVFRAFVSGNYYEAILWAKKVTENENWVKTARDQQARKEREIGGIVDYPWGTPLENAKDQKRAIQRYGVLNEVGIAMWGLAVSYYKLGDIPQAKAWIRSLIEVAAYHQIFAPDGPGYWNALVSWETNPGGTPLDAEMGLIYRDVLAEMGRASGLPKTFPVK